MNDRGCWSPACAVTNGREPRTRPAQIHVRHRRHLRPLRPRARLPPAGMLSTFSLPGPIRPCRETPVSELLAYHDLLGQAVGFVALVLCIAAFASKDDNRLLVILIFGNAALALQYALFAAWAAAGIMMLNTLRVVLARRMPRNWIVMVLFLAATVAVAAATWQTRNRCLPACRRCHWDHCHVHASGHPDACRAHRHRALLDRDNGTDRVLRRVGRRGVDPGDKSGHRWPAYPGRPHAPARTRT